MILTENLTVIHIWSLQRCCHPNRLGALSRKQSKDTGRNGPALCGTHTSKFSLLIFFHYLSIRNHPAPNFQLLVEGVFSSWACSFWNTHTPVIILSLHLCFLHLLRWLIADCGCCSGFGMPKRLSQGSRRNDQSSWEIVCLLQKMESCLRLRTKTQASCLQANMYKTIWKARGIWLRCSFTSAEICTSVKLFLKWNPWWECEFGGTPYQFCIPSSYCRIQQSE